MLVTVPVVEASTVTLIVTVASAPAGSVPRSQVTVPPASVQAALGGYGGHVGELQPAANR